MTVSVLTTRAKEESTYIITVAIEDEDGNAVAPSTMYWTLTDADGTVINSRSAVEIAIPESSNDIVLTGDDLAVTESGDAVRELAVWGTYDSDAGVGLSFSDAIRFVVDQIVGIT